MKRFEFFPLIFMVIFLFCFQSWAQTDKSQTSTWQIELNDKSKLVGYILSEDEKSIHFKTLSGMEMNIPRNQISKIDLIVGEIVSGSIWRNDPNRTRLLFSPTGRALKRGQGYFAIYEIFFPFVAIGVTDWFTVAGGLTLFPGASSQFIYLAPKITPIQVEKFDLSAGVLYIRIPDFDDDDDDDEINSAGIIYGVSTYGTEKSALTFGVGFAFGGGEIADKPIFVLGGEVRASKSIKFISENWLVPDSEVQLLSAGIRFFGENLAADFALLYPFGADMEGFPFFPWIGFAYNFGSKK
jgi:hypothetical protein